VINATLKKIDAGEGGGEIFSAALEKTRLSFLKAGKMMGRSHKRTPYKDKCFVKENKNGFHAAKNH
jgi:hypothetical protein